MMNRLIAVLFLCTLALLPSALAQIGADWQSAPVRFSPDLSMAGFCNATSQCLLHIQGNTSYDGDTSRYFRLSNPKLWPKCINNSQYVLDYRCENGNWTTRTKNLALQLLAFADATSPTNFTLFCDSYNRVLNQFRYLTEDLTLAEDYLRINCPSEGDLIPCVNSLCVLKTPMTVAVGTTLNAPVNSASHSFLWALNKSSELCNSVSSTATAFVSCGQNVWYNPALQAIVWLPTGTLEPPAAATQAAIISPLGALSQYVMTVLHNPATLGMNFTYFPKTRLFNHLYVAKNGDRDAFGFLEQNIRPDYEPVPLDYIGVRYSNINLGTDPCLNIIKVADTKAFCENQTSPTGFNVIARHRCESSEPTCKGASPIVLVWSALTGKLRP